MTRALALVAGLAVAAVIAGCGGGGDHQNRSATKTAPATPGVAPSKAVVRVIRGWTDTLRHGDVTGASRYFAVPVLVQNNTDAIKLRSRAEVEFFNGTLPCGAVLVRSQTLGIYTIGVFRLTERPGPGTCGDGAGEEAAVAFLVHGGRIVQWRRLPAVPPPESGPEPPAFDGTQV